MIKLKPLLNILFEDPDHIELPIEHIDLSYKDTNAIAFGYLDNQMVLIDKTVHWEILNYYPKLQSKYKDTFIDRYKLKWAGRIWYSRRIISFWDFPTSKSIIKKIIIDINNESDRLINNGKPKFPKFKIDNDWYIDTIDIINNKPKEVLQKIKDYTKIPANLKMKNWGNFYNL